MENCEKRQVDPNEDKIDQLMKSESSDEEQIQHIMQDFNTDKISNDIEKKYNPDIIKRFIEQIYYFNSLELLGNWNLFCRFFKDMEITDCIGYFGYLKVNGFLEDVHLFKTFNSENQLNNIKFIEEIQKRSKYQIERIIPKDDNIISISDDSPIIIESDDEILTNNDNDNNNDKKDLQDADEDSINEELKEEIEKKSSKVIKMPTNKYNHYKDFKIVVDKALKYILIGKKVSWISKELNIPYTTLRDWKKRYLLDKSYRPYRRYRKTKYFTQEEDSRLFQNVKTEMKRKRFNFLNFLEILNSFFLTSLFHRQNPGIKPKFNSQWISHWRKSHKISLRKYHFRRRSLNDPIEIENFREDVYSAINRYGSKNVYNMDETSWGLVPHEDKVWALTGSDEVIFDTTKQYPTKYKFTAIATINADGQKLPLITVAKGKTVRCEKAFKTIYQNTVMHSTNGWSTEDLIISYLQWLSDKCHNAPICLIWDQFKAHLTQKVEEKASLLKIQIIKVPAGQTGSEQPLDRLIFGSMKKTADKLWNEKLVNGEKDLYTKQTATLIMLESWNSIKETTVKKSWDHFFTVASEDMAEMNNDHDWYPEEEDNEIDN